MNSKTFYGKNKCDNAKTGDGFRSDDDLASDSDPF